MYLAHKLFPTFATAVNKDPTRIAPLPAAVLRSLAEFAEESPANILRAFLENPQFCEVVERKFSAKMKDFKQKVYSIIGVPKPINVGPVLTELGIEAQGVPNENGDRVFVNLDGKGIKFCIE